MDTAILAAFLADIKARPADPTPRLILADWLEEHADSDADRGRAELLRLSARHPGVFLSDDGPAAEQLRALFATHRAAWLGPVADVSGACTFNLYRGLFWLSAAVSQLLSKPLRDFAEGPGWLWVGGLTVTGADRRFARLWERPWLATVAWLRVWCRRELLRQHAAALFASPHLGGVRDFGFGDGLLADPALAVQLAAWEGLRHVEVLDLANSGLSPEGCAALLGSPHLGGLGRLVLRRCRVGDAGLRALLAASLPRLRHLDLSHTGLDDVAALWLARWPGLAAVEVLDVEGNALTDEARAALRSSPHYRDGWRLGDGRDTP